MLYEISYEYPIGSGKIVRHNVPARTAEEAIQRWGVSNNPSLKARVAQEEIDKAYVEALRDNEKRKRTKKMPVMLPVSGTCSAFVELLKSIGYYFDVRVREDGIDSAELQYREWTGEDLPEAAVYFHTNPDAWTAVEWRIQATVPEGTVFPFDTAVAGTLGRGNSVESALLDGCRLTINCTSIVEQLTRAGLRVCKERSWSM